MELLTKMLKIYSPSSREGNLANFLKDEMDKLGFKTKIDHVGNLIGKIGRGKKKVLLVGHLDTVEGEIPVEVKNGRIYGRGSVDAKGPFATFIHAASKFKNSERLIIWVIGAVEEESSSCGVHFLKDKYNPDYVVIGEPSSWEGITLGYRGSMGIFYSLEKPLTHRGHSDQIPAEEAFHFYSKLRGKFYCQENGFRSVSVRLTRINTKKDPFKDSVEMKIDVRLPPGTDFSKLKKFITVIKGRAILNFKDETKAIKASKNNKLVRSFLRSIRDCGGKPRFKLKTGTSDMNILGNNWNCPILAYGPGDSSLDHTPHENLEIEDYNMAKQVLSRALNILGEE
jgi:LysW-gamma-L-lysine carboxypeptidase